MHMFIECVNVDYKSTRKESFMDLQLDVKGCKNIYDSFDKYCEVEMMDGQNQYKTDDYGLQARSSFLSPFPQAGHARFTRPCIPTVEPTCSLPRPFHQ